MSNSYYVSKKKKRRNETEIIEDVIQILREEGNMPKNRLLMKVQINSHTGKKILNFMLKWDMITIE